MGNEQRLWGVFKPGRRSHFVYFPRHVFVCLNAAAASQLGLKNVSAKPLALLFYDVRV